MTEHDVDHGTARSPEWEALQQRLREGAKSFALGLGIAIAGIAVIAALFLNGLALVLPLLFFAGVAVFTRRMAAEERQWRERIGR